MLIDAGHGIVPFLLKHNNRIPEAIVLTHPHFDHILGIDWIIQSYYRFNHKKAYPVYATKPCWNTVLRTLPHLRELVIFFELKPGEALKRHITPVDVNFYILEGNGIVEIGKEREYVKKDQLIFSPAKITHTLLNESDKNFRFLVIKTPTPTSETKLL